MKRLPRPRHSPLALCLIVLMAVACGESPVSPDNVGVDLLTLPPQDGGTKELPPPVATATLIDPTDGTVVRSVAFCRLAETNTITLRISLKNFDAEWVAGTFLTASGAERQLNFFFPNGYWKSNGFGDIAHWAETNLRLYPLSTLTTSTGHVDVTIMDPDPGSGIYDSPYRILLAEVNGSPYGYSPVWNGMSIDVDVELSKTGGCTQHVIN